MTHSVLRRHDVERVTGLPRSTIYDKMKAGEFPKPIPLSGRSVGWLSNEIESWLKERVAARDGVSA